VVSFDDRRSYEVSVEIMLCESQKCGTSYSLDIVRKMFGDKKCDDYSAVEVTTQNGLSLVLFKSIPFLLETGSSLFSGDNGQLDILP